MDLSRILLAHQAVAKDFPRLLHEREWLGTSLADSRLDPIGGGGLIRIWPASPPGCGFVSQRVASTNPIRSDPIHRAEMLLGAAVGRSAIAKSVSVRLTPERRGRRA